MGYFRFSRAESDGKPLSGGQIVATINTALTELHNNVGSPLLKVAGFNGATRGPRLNKLILCVGASHMRRLTDAFTLLGEKAMHVECVTFRATS
jgi:hypothetical protein